MSHRIVVVGGVAAGPSAASKAKRVNPDVDVLLLEQGEFISYGICEVPYYIGNVVTDRERLVAFTPRTLEQKKGVRVKSFRRAEEIHASKKVLVVRNLERNRTEEYRYDRLVIATGSRSRNLNLPGEEARNVFRVKTLEDGFAIKRWIEDHRPKRGVIIGGGYVGMEMAEALVSNGVDTVILHRGDLPMSGLELETRKAVVGELSSNGVKFIPHSETRSLRTDENNTVTDVVSSSGMFPADIVILSLGVEPNIELAKTARVRLGPNGGILTDQRQLTGVDSIYAAGDCCEVRNVVNNKWMYIPLATYASRQGWVAGENAAGGSAIFKGAIRAIAVKVFGLEVAQVGISAEEAEESGFSVLTEQVTANSKVGYYPGNARVTLIGVADRRTRRLLGVNVFGKEGAVLRANTLGVAIQHHLTLDDLARLDMIYTPPYAPLWDPVLVLANQLRKRR